MTDSPIPHSRYHNRIASVHEEATAWRRDLHAHPEIGFEEHRTAGIIADRLREFGVDEVITGLGRTGVVGIVRGRGDGPMIGLRSDIDALPMQERGDIPHRSTVPGRMHACGHDGHTAMLLAAGQILAETRDFAGSVALIFQPAEEGGGGGRVMVEDGLFERADCTSVWGLHNWPGLPLGQFCALAGNTMAGIDYFDIAIEGQGTHSGMPHEGVDTVLAAAHLVAAIQSITGRSISPHRTATVGVSMFKGSEAYVVMPDRAVIGGSVRYFDADVRDRIEARLRTLATSVARAFDAEAVIDYRRNYPPTVNPPAEAGIAAEIAESVAGPGSVVREHDPCMAGEDFAFMLNERPGHYIWMGVDEPGHRSGKLHYPDYDFNDAAIPHGVAYWLALVDRLLPAPR
jgi:amidohydrolase